MTKKRGAPLGNTNALKHGFYSRQFREIESADLDAINANLEGEIAALRVWIRRSLEVFDGAEDPDVETQLKILAGLGNAFTKIANLTRAQQLLGGQTDDTLACLARALATVQADLPIFKNRS